MRAVMWSMSKSWFCWDMDWNVPPSSSTDCTKEGVGWLHSSVPAEMATSKQPPPPSAEPVHIIGCHPFKGHSSVPAEMATSKRLPLNRPAPYHWMQPLQSPTGLDGEDAGGLQV